jgi:phosphoglycolate phosphatase
MKPAPELIVFDLDGTLVDSAPDLAYSVDALLEKLNRPPARVDKVRGWIGNGVPMLVKRALTGEMWPVGDPDGFREAQELFTGIYEANVCERSRLFDGVMEGLRRVKAEGYRTACLTNKHSRFTLPLLAQLGICDYFDYIGCGDQFDKHKPDPYPLLKTAERFRVAPERCLMVGDSENDVQAARAAGFGIVCVPYGYRSCERVEDLKADGVIRTLTELLDFLRSKYYPRT